MALASVLQQALQWYGTVITWKTLKLTPSGSVRFTNPSGRTESFNNSSNLKSINSPNSKEISDTPSGRITTYKPNTHG